MCSFFTTPMVTSAGLLLMLCDHFTRLLRGILRADGSSGPSLGHILNEYDEHVIDMWRLTPCPRSGSS
jgi:hypothetical protein